MIADPDQSPPSQTNPKPSTSLSVARFGSIMVAGLLLSRVLGMVREAVMTAQFGFGLESDSFKIAAQIPDTIFMLIAGGGLSSAFIPVFSDLIHRDKEQEAWKVFSVVVTLCSIVAPILVLVAWVFAPEIVEFFRGTKPLSVLPAATRMSRIMLPAQIAFLVGSILLATLYSRKRFVAPSLAPNVYNLGIILAALILPAALHMGIESMAWGALAGAFVGNIALPIVSMVKEGSHFQYSLDLKQPGVRKFFMLLLPVVLGFSLPSMVNLVTQKFAGYYGLENGVNTVLYEANYLMQAPLGIFGQALALAVFPVLAEYVARNRMDLYRDQISNTVRQVLYLGMLSGALMLALAQPIVHFLFSWGAASKNGSQLGQTVDCLRIYSLGIFAWCVQPVLMRGFFSLHKTLKPVAFGTLMTGAFILMCMFVVNRGYDFRMLAWATDIAAILLVIGLYFALEGEVGRLDQKGIIQTFGKSLVACVPASAIAYEGTLLLPAAHGPLFRALALMLFGLAGFWTFFFVSRLLRMPETEFLDKVLSKLRRVRTT